MTKNNYNARDENICFYLIRYARDRNNTSCVPDIISYILENLDKIRGVEKPKMIREIKEGEVAKSCYKKLFDKLIKELEK